MKRNEHTFQFTGKQIGAAALAEAQYHLERLQFWDDEQDSMKEAAGSVAVATREYQVTGGKRVELVIDQSIANRLTECGNKIAAHRKAADTFRIEAAAYATQPDRSYELHPDDIVYFRLAGGPREE